MDFRLDKGGKSSELFLEWRNPQNTSVWMLFFINVIYFGNK